MGKAPCKDEKGYGCDTVLQNGWCETDRGIGCDETCGKCGMFVKYYELH